MRYWRSSFITLSIILACLCIAQVTQQDFSKAFETDVTALLPNEDSENAILARSLINETQGKVIYASLSNQPKDDALNAKLKATLLTELQASPLIESVTPVDNSLLEETFTTVSKNKLHLLFPKWLASKKNEFERTNEAGDFFTWAANSAVADLDSFFESPEAMQLSDEALMDPLLLNISALKAFTNGQAMEQNNDSSRYWIRISQPPLDKKNQENVEALFTSTEKALAAISPEAQLDYGGLMRLASASRQRIHADVVKINILSIIGVILVSSFMINRPWILIKALPTVAFAYLGSISACFFFFGSVHIIALVIGSILTGISIDYAFHMLFQSDEKINTRKLVFFACLSTIAGAITLSSSDLLLIRQIGVFTIFGLIFAFTYSQTLSKANWEKSSKAKKFKINIPKSLKILATLVVVIASVFGLFGLEWGDDVRKMEAADPQLTEHDLALRSEFGGSSNSQVYLSIGSSYLDSLQQGKTFVESIKSEDIRQTIFAPSMIFSTSQEVAHLLGEKEFLPDFFNTLKNTLEDAGFDTASFGNFFAEAAHFSKSSLETEVFESKIETVANSIRGPLEGLLKKSGDSYWSVISIPSNETIETQSFTHIAKLSNLEFINEALNNYRDELVRFGIFAMGIVAGIILCSFGIKTGTLIISIPILSVSLALGLSSLLSTTLNIFHITGAFLAMALSLDYALFSVGALSKKRPIPFSVFLSAATTASSFLALTFSAIPVVRALGIIVLATTLSSILLIYLLEEFYPNQKEENK